MSIGHTMIKNCFKYSFEGINLKEIDTKIVSKKNNRGDVMTAKKNSRYF